MRLAQRRRREQDCIGGGAERGQQAWDMSARSCSWRSARSVLSAPTSGIDRRCVHSYIRHARPLPHMGNAPSVPPTSGPTSRRRPRRSRPSDRRSSGRAGGLDAAGNGLQQPTIGPEDEDHAGSQARQRRPPPASLPAELQMRASSAALTTSPSSVMHIHINCSMPPMRTSHSLTLRPTDRFRPTFIAPFPPSVFRPVVFLAVCDASSSLQLHRSLFCRPLNHRLR